MDNLHSARTRRSPLKVRRPLDWDAVGASAMINILALFLPIAMLQVFDHVIPKKSTDTLNGLFLILVCVVLIDLALKLLRETIVTGNARRMERRVGRHAINKVFGADPQALDRIGAERIIDNLVSIPKLRRLFKGQGRTAIVDLFFSVAFLAVVWVFAGSLVLVPLGIIAVSAAISLALRRRHLRAVGQRVENERRRAAFLTEVFNRMRLVKIFGIEPQILRRYENLQNSSATVNETLAWVSDLATNVQTTCGQITTAITCAYGAHLVIAGIIGIGELSACMLLCGRAVQPVARALFTDSQINHARDTRTRLNALLETPTCHGRTRREQALTGAVRFERVSIARTETGQPGFRDLSFDLGAGSLMTIDGAVETGAALIPALVAGEVRPDSGKIVAGGIDARRLGHLTGPSGIVLVDRMEPMFLASLRENLMAYRGLETERHANDIARSLGLDAYIKYMPGGHECLLSKSGGTAGSVGTYAQIAMVRALACEPKILLLRSPFADLDAQSSRRLERLLAERAGRTTVILSDPTPEMRRRADLHLDLDAHVAGRSPESAYVARDRVLADMRSPVGSVPAYRTADHHRTGRA